MHAIQHSHGLIDEHVQMNGSFVCKIKMKPKTSLDLSKFPANMSHLRIHSFI